VGRNTVEKEKLKCAEPERYANFRVELASRPLEIALQALVEPNLPAQDAKH
jgi:hypothetical protein